MKTTTITINNREYPLACTLRVAYTVQGQHNHAPYSKVFADIGNMTIEDQIGILYAAFITANPEASREISSNVFQAYCLDTFNLKELMGMLQRVIEGIMGTPVEGAESQESNDPQ